MLRRAVREEQSISLPEAVRKLTSLPAEVYGLAGKGRIAARMDADLTLFDAAKITDHATYTQPLLPNEGIRRVYLWRCLRRPRRPVHRRHGRQAPPPHPLILFYPPQTPAGAG